MATSLFGGITVWRDSIDAPWGIVETGCEAFGGLLLVYGVGMLLPSLDSRNALHTISSGLGTSFARVLRFSKHGAVQTQPWQMCGTKIRATHSLSIF